MEAIRGLGIAMDNREAARKLMSEYRERGDALGWFEELYHSAGENRSKIPWADARPNPNLVTWLASNPRRPTWQNCLVIGCGLGDDAELLASFAEQVTAFDISQSAIEWCRKRFPNSSVRYEVADACHIPSKWWNCFDFVFEAYTLQVLPVELRKLAAAEIAKCVASGGHLLVVARAREESDSEGNMPWPLTKTDLGEFERRGLQLENFEDYLDDKSPPVRRFRALYRKR